MGRGERGHEHCPADGTAQGKALVPGIWTVGGQLSLLVEDY